MLRIITWICGTLWGNGLCQQSYNYINSLLFYYRRQWWEQICYIIEKFMPMEQDGSKPTASHSHGWQVERHDLKVLHLLPSIYQHKSKSTMTTIIHLHAQILKDFILCHLFIYKDHKVLCLWSICLYKSQNTSSVIHLFT